MTLDQKRARWFGVLYLITFIASIPALLLYETVLRHKVSYVAGAGHDKQVLFAAFLELLLIIANIGTAVVIFPILRRQNEELSLGYVTARVVESTFILVGILCMVTSSRCRITLSARRRPRSPTPSPRSRTGHSCSGPVGRRLGQRADPRLPDVQVPAGAAAVVLVRPHRWPAGHHHRDGRLVHRQRPEQRTALGAVHPDHPRDHLGTLPRRLLHLERLQAASPILRADAREDRGPTMSAGAPA